MTESSTTPRSTARHARPLPPPVRTPRIRPLAATPASATTAARTSAGSTDGAGADRTPDHTGPADRLADAGRLDRPAHTGHAAHAARPDHPDHTDGRPHPRRAADRPASDRSAAARPVRHPRAACAGPPGPHPREQEARSRRAARAELAGRFALRLVEVLTGVRPAGQLQRHTTLDGYGRLTALVRSGPLRPRGADARPRLGRVHDSAPSADVVEACVRVEFGRRHHVVAFRLEQHRRTGQWQCATVESR
ncbi:Rv3235 family protein [Kitasatospora sp. NBC_00315]|uniref:Rv3235 family protein n=1 Tax=Kitasatospora sp. NBC_00315 TaxID=2975963 RepID=UPI00324EBBDA